MGDVTQRIPRDLDNKNVKAAIRAGEYHAIPESKKSQSFFDKNPWPPRQFICGRCGHTYNGLVPRHACGSDSGYYPDVLIYDFCTHCGEYFNQYMGLHRCKPYGKHCRTTDSNPETFYMRVFGVYTPGRHHFEWSKPLMYCWVESFTGPSQFRYVGIAAGIERAKLLLGLGD